MKNIKLNSINFDVINFKDVSEADLQKYEFSIKTIGEREYYITKEVLGKNKLTYQFEDRELITKVNSCSYTRPQEFNDDTTVYFHVTIKEYNSSDEKLGPTSLLAIEIFDMNCKIDALVNVLEKKGITDKEYFEKSKLDYMKNIGNEGIKSYIKRVLHEDVELEE